MLLGVLLDRGRSNNDAFLQLASVVLRIVESEDGVFDIFFMLLGDLNLAV
jgi:hypothetical protein